MSVHNGRGEKNHGLADEDAEDGFPRTRTQLLEAANMILKKDVRHNFLVNEDGLSEFSINFAISIYSLRNLTHFYCNPLSYIFGIVTTV